MPHLVLSYCEHKNEWQVWNKSVSAEFFYTFDTQELAMEFMVNLTAKLFRDIVY